MPGLIMTVGTAWKRALYLGFLFLLVALKQSIVAAPPSSPTSVLGGPLLTQRSKVILWPAFPGQVCGQACQVVRISVSVCVVSVHKCAHTLIRGGSIVTVGNLFASCSTSSPLLTVAKMLGAILIFSFSKGWHTTLKSLQWTWTLKHRTIRTIYYSNWGIFFFLHVEVEVWRAWDFEGTKVMCWKRKLNLILLDT